jgi:hypothetical protein
VEGRAPARAGEGGNEGKEAIFVRLAAHNIIIIFCHLYSPGMQAMTIEIRPNMLPVVEVH